MSQTNMVLALRWSLVGDDTPQYGILLDWLLLNNGIHSQTPEDPVVLYPLFHLSSITKHLFY